MKHYLSSLGYTLVESLMWMQMASLLTWCTSLISLLGMNDGWMSSFRVMTSIGLDLVPVAAKTISSKFWTILSPATMIRLRLLALFIDCHNFRRVQLAEFSLCWTLILWVCKLGP